ncbi:hypothetical protein RhiirA1_445083 [Rhizophagus irregularis]|uniref:Uncharacterized protein n=4 Tax=Rhizophagus irregularis TaxID=588596 RepID=A0A2N0RA06_9GLOM|nr:hypothetical protein GLOIN_2v1878823 [Rhizophagus irregularis DAOM 181602=DAOM 197198]EXX77292.1 hypothetical protein RirG_025140 [Rhizophagus irregularis DAOM 197198w]PKC60140.1 hypothetical protein RhiirA1_445083 [Rhizophagus irregularis]POG67830.1 hypothetical protein GLOIN_2v1878823 [Rhizophagus irregularis DAOM 181602=DAOM 197198]UZO15767.1 hypothetical protein OCT59_007183 [Rhizophagus irregularis]CAB4477983.1 unnamed protein product [Rhizophagus irregularis]|eukprot:XP_025174696.1 hypothetical protein GLOIN_2v1878823 [Rhizophagus irregularis DAOM 181602=DAOM 197198]
MCLLTDESKRHIKKKWNRVTSSIWTKLFSAIFTIQFGLVVFFQSRVLVRNYSIYNDDRFKEAYKCDKDEDNSVEYLFAFSAIQSLVFMVLQLYLVYFGLNAIFHEHIIQIITLVALNFGSAAYSLVQLLQIKIRVDRIQNNDNCNAGLTGFDIDWLRVDLPQVLTLTTISVISAIIASKLYRQFGWSVYKRIGGDLRIQRIYRSNLIFIMLLKLNLFFWIIYIIPTVIVALKITDFSGGKVVDVVLIAYHGFATLLALILQILAYSSIKRESTAGMIAFSVLWTLIVADYGLLIYAFVRLLILGSYFMIIFTSVFVVIALVTFVFSIIVTVNFGRGLKELIENYKYRLRPRPTTIDIPTLNVPPGTSSSSVYSPASLMSQQHPPTSPLSLSDSISNLSDEQKKNQQQKDDDRWTIDD